MRVIPTTKEDLKELRSAEQLRVLEGVVNRPVYMNHKRRCEWIKRRQKELHDLRFHCCGYPKMDKYMVIRRKGDTRDCYDRMFRYRRLLRAPKGWEIVWVTGKGNPYGVGGFLKEPFNGLPILE